MIGRLINDIRNIYEVPLEELAEGLCSAGMLRKYETEEEEIEKLLADALFQRLGKSLDKYDVMLGLQEYWQAETRCQIQILLRMGELEKADQKIQEYEKRIGKERQLHEQFLALQKAELGRRKELPPEVQEQLVLTGLAKTIPELKKEEMRTPALMKRRRFGMLELLLLERYAILQEQQGREEEALSWYQEIGNYLEPELQPKGTYKISEYDRADRNKLYPLLLYQQAGLRMKGKSYERALALLEKACEMLSEAQNQCPLFVRVMERKFVIQKECGQTIVKWEENCLKQLLQIIGEQEKIWREDWYPMYEELHIHSVNWMLRERRILRGFTEEELALEICDVRTVKRAERTASKLQRKNRDMLLARLGISNMKYDGGIVTGRYSDYKKYGRMKDLLNQGDYEAAEKIYLELKKGARKECITNQQFVKHWEIVIKYGKGELDKEQCCKELWELLKLTLPIADAKLRGECTLMKHEREVLILLAWYDTGRYRTRLIPLLWEQYQRLGGIGKARYFDRDYYTSLIYCMAKLYRREGEIKLAEQVLENGMKQQLFLHEDIDWSRLLFGKFCLEKDKQERENIKPKEDIFFWLCSAYAISKLYLKDESFVVSLRKYVSKHYKEMENELDNLFETNY